MQKYVMGRDEPIAGTGYFSRPSSIPGLAVIGFDSCGCRQVNCRPAGRITHHWHAKLLPKAGGSLFIFRIGNTRNSWHKEGLRKY